MAPSNYSGAWKRATLPVSLVPGKPAIDKEHSYPSDAPDPSYVLSYVDNTGAPTLPDEWQQGQYVQDWVASDFTDQTPVSHEIGVGFLPGVSLEDAQAVGGYARSQDLGAPDYRDYLRPRYQEDGTGHGEIVNTDLGGASPADLKYDEKGVGVGIDPYARSNRHITHQHTGPSMFDYRWYDPSMRPRYLHQAAGSTVRETVPGRQANTPDSGSGVILRPDNWAAPVVRRASASWDQAFATDAETPVTAGGDFGLGSWGL